MATVYCDFEDPRRYKEAVALFKSSILNPQSSIHLATPRILKPGETGYLKLIESAGPDGLLLRNLAALDYYKHRSDLKKIGDFSLNVANPITARLLMENAGLDYLTVSYDLNIGQVLDLLGAAPPEWFELTLHQHMPMFHMEHCVFCVFLSKGTTAKDCGRPCETPRRPPARPRGPAPPPAGRRRLPQHALQRQGANRRQVLRPTCAPPDSRASAWNCSMKTPPPPPGPSAPIRICCAARRMPQAC